MGYDPKITVRAWDRADPEFAILVRTDVSRPESPVEVDYLEGGGWNHTQYQSVYAGGGLRGGLRGLARIAEDLLRDAEDPDHPIGSVDWRVEK